MIPYEGCKIVGPHRKENFRFEMQITKPDGKKRYVKYHRYLMELHLGRYLETNEHVHHIDHDQTNNSIDNLQLMTASEHGFHHHGSPPEAHICPRCGKHFILEGKQLSARKSNVLSGTKSGPFCTRGCAIGYTKSNPPESFTCVVCEKVFQLCGKKLAAYKFYRKTLGTRPCCSSLCRKVNGRKRG